MGANSYPQDVERGLFEGNPLADLIEGFRLTLEAGGELEAGPVVHVQLRPGVALSAVEADQLAKICQQGVQRQLDCHAGDFAAHPEQGPAANELAIAVHPYRSGPFADPAAIRNGYLLRDGS
ncbi:coenzyme f390 synthetase [Streptomyces yunnanensis]|uniref:Phenylacetate-CoA ligase n=1 Tax=Streptomyces yunnanensis TaxID=156453 RepID=A0A9X8N6N8_9ACTN|nr:coenzyme f390 synthetase [Streptomyces yunnanensis]SHN16830.1 phenylacetate-CoA ligase [Streptomyces yunnanensis]